jgi:hypothetical protein
MRNISSEAKLRDPVRIIVPILFPVFGIEGDNEGLRGISGDIHLRDIWGHTLKGYLGTYT